MIPSNDDTHPAPDLAGYITEDQVYTDRDLNPQDIRPPVSPLPSLSRFMDDGAGEGLAHRDYTDVSD